MTVAGKPTILLINPNTSNAMTEALKPIVDRLGLSQTNFEYFTATGGVPSINDERDEEVSTWACLAHFKAFPDWFQQFDAYLICCYSKHSLVPAIRHLAPEKPVTGIFEASIASCLQIINISPSTDAQSAKFGIVSTGKQWEHLLQEAVAGLLGTSRSTRYAGTETTGFSAVELHTAAKRNVDDRIKAAAKCLIDKGAQAICLGCAGMAGMEQTVREACIEHLGEQKGRRIRIIDGVVAGVIFLDGALRGGIL